MSQVQANPEELRAFAARLANCSQAINEEAEGTAAAFSSLGDTWNDAKRSEFEEVFEELLSCIRRFHDACEDQVPYLQNLASHLEDYNAL